MDLAVVTCCFVKSHGSRLSEGIRVLDVVIIRLKNFIVRTSLVYLDTMNGNKAYRYFYFGFYFTHGAGSPLSDSN